MRSVVITSNVVYASNIGIGVSVAEGAGKVLISDNMVHEPSVGEIVGLKWTEVAETDLRAVVDRYPHVTIR